MLGHEVSTSIEHLNVHLLTLEVWEVFYAAIDLEGGEMNNELHSFTSNPTESVMNLCLKLV